MRKKVFLTLATFLTSMAVVQAQDEPTLPVTEKAFKINFLAPGFEYELPISQTSTININPYLGFSLSVDNQTGIEADLFPSLNLEARKYYNLSKRKDNGKNTAFNSGNFIALSVSGAMASLIDNNRAVNEASYAIGPVWGLQRNYASGFNLTLTLGPGYIKNNIGDSGLTLLSSLNLGFLIGRK